MSLASTTSVNENQSLQDPAMMAHSPEWLSVVEFCSLLPIIAVTVVSSSLLLIVVIKESNLRESPGFLMAILSVLDLLLVTGDSTIVAVQLAREIFGFEFLTYPFICPTQIVAINYLYGLQSSAVMMCAVDQVVAIVKPLYYNCFKNRVTKYILIALILCWIAMSPVCIFMLAMSKSLDWVPSFSGCAALLDIGKIKAIMLSQYTFFYIVPGAVIVGCYVTIAIVVKRSAARRSVIAASSRHQYTTRQTQQNSANSNANRQKQLEICRTLFAITVSYYISFLPFFIYQILLYWRAVPVSSIIYRFLKTLRMLAGASDGIVFYTMNKKFRMGVRKLVLRSQQSRPNTGMTQLKVLGALNGTAKRSDSANISGVSRTKSRYETTSSQL